MINIVHTASELDEFLKGIIRISLFKLDEMNFSNQTDWLFNDGALSHKSGGFFDVIGIEDSNNKEYLMLYQPQSALTGLAICVKENSIYILLQARIEPGNTGIGQYGPTIQSTPANFSALHGGANTPTLDLFYGYNKRIKPVGSSMQLDLGERYFQKSKWHNYILVEELFETENHMTWVTLEILKERLDQDNYLNADLRSLLAVFNWDKLIKQNTLSLSSEDQILNKLGQLRNSTFFDYRFKQLDKLINWKITSNGIEPLDPKNVCVKLFNTICSTREVKAWNQPLMLAQSKGMVVLLLRKKGNEIECLLSINKELGIAHQYVITASCIVNPGETIREVTYGKDSSIIHEFVQSDEGGRFVRHENINRVVLINQDIDINENQFWVSISSLKNILSMSNLASFQLRCISSVLLFQLNDSILEKRHLLI